MTKAGGALHFSASSGVVSPGGSAGSADSRLLCGGCAGVSAGMGVVGLWISCGLANHGWEYRAGVRTLPHIVVSNTYCECVVEHATRWLSDPPEEPFPLTAGFRNARPYPLRAARQPDTTDADIDQLVAQVADLLNERRQIT